MFSSFSNASERQARNDEIKVHSLNLTLYSYIFFNFFYIYIYILLLISSSTYFLIFYLLLI